MIDLQEFFNEFIDYLMDDKGIAEEKVLNMSNEELKPLWEEFCSKFRSSSTQLCQLLKVLLQKQGIGASSSILIQLRKIGEIVYKLRDFPFVYLRCMNLI